MIMKKYLWIFISAVLLETIVFPLRGLHLPTYPYLGHQVCMLVGTVLFFLLTVYLLRKYKNRIKPSYTVILLLIGCCILELPDGIFIYIRYGNLTASPPQLLLRWIAIFLGLIYCKMETRKKRNILLFCGLILLLIALWGNVFWFQL